MKRAEIWYTTPAQKFEAKNSAIDEEEELTGRYNGLR